MVVKRNDSAIGEAYIRRRVILKLDGYKTSDIACEGQKTSSTRTDSEILPEEVTNRMLELVSSS